MRVLFVCSSNLIRSPTAAAHFDGKHGIEARSAGLGADAVIPLTGDLIAWADLVLTMEDALCAMVRQRFGEALADTPLASLEVPDRYKRGEPALIARLEEVAAPWLGHENAATGGGRENPAKQE